MEIALQCSLFLAAAAAARAIIRSGGGDAAKWWKIKFIPLASIFSHLASERERIFYDFGGGAGRMIMTTTTTTMRELKWCKWLRSAMKIKDGGNETLAAAAEIAFNGFSSDLCLI
jgi:hypothetical protein